MNNQATCELTLAATATTTQRANELFIYNQYYKKVY